MTITYHEARERLLGIEQAKSDMIGLLEDRSYVAVEFDEGEAWEDEDGDLCATVGSTINNFPPLHLYLRYQGGKTQIRVYDDVYEGLDEASLWRNLFWALSEHKGKVAQ